MSSEFTRWLLVKFAIVLLLASNTSQEGAGGSKGRQFPKLSDFFGSENHDVMHMKSEILIKQLKKEEDVENLTLVRDYVLDEWIRDQQTIRLTSSRMRINFDLLIDGRELFDLSNEYNCYYKPLELDPIFVETDSNLINFWNNKATLIVHLSHLYYSPVGLWSLAERVSPDLRQMISDPEDEKLEIWRIKSPPRRRDVMDQHQWQYDMKFEKEFQVEEDGSPKSADFTYVLDSIEVRDRDDDLKDYVTLVDVHSYRYNLSEREVGAVNPFRLPEAYGCSRNPKWNKGLDEFSLPTEKLGYQLDYEATLELFEYKNYVMLERRYVLPKLTGSWLELKQSGGLRLNFTSHQSRSHTSDGTFRAHRLIFDKTNRFAQSTDETSGLCERERKLDFDWVLKFPRDDSSAREEKILLDRQMIESLFLNNNNNNSAQDRKFGLVNKDKRGRVVFRTYERRVNKLTLSQKISGPATLIRTFTRTDNEHLIHIMRNSSSDYVDIHDSIKVRVYIFDDVRLLVLAILTLNVRATGIDHLADGLARINLGQCSASHDDAAETFRLRSIETFSLEYELDRHQGFFIQLMQRQVKDDIYLALVKYIKLAPIQLDGNIRLEANYNGEKDNGTNLMRIQIHFNVLDTPMAHLFYIMVNHRRLNQQLEAKSRVRLVDSIEGCSSWCDTISCSSMTYCNDHLCYVTHDDMIINTNSSIEDEHCSLYYRQDKSISLKTFEQSMDSLVNIDRNMDTLQGLRITLPSGGVVLPSRFSRFGAKFSNEDQDFDLTPTSKETYRIIERNYKIDAAKFVDNLKNRRKLAKKFTPKLLNGLASQADCLNVCRNIDESFCMFTSHCQRDSQCLLISLNEQGDQISLGTYDQRDLLEDTKVPSDECSITMRDFSDEFDKFTKTRKPQKFLNQLIGYDEINCAAACKLNPNCWSFDICRDDQTDSPPSCYLQKTHMNSANFDSSSFFSRSELNETDETCDHYSRSVIDDFKVIKNKRITKSLWQLSRGFNEDRCALDCERNESCLGFEYCFDSQQDPSQSCRYMTFRAEDSSSGLNFIKADIESQLEDSSYCSIYLLARLETSQMFEQIYGQPNGGYFVWQLCWWYIVKILAAMSLGMIVKFTFRRLTSRSELTVRRPSQVSVRL